MERIVIPELNIPKYQVRVIKRPAEKIIQLNTELIQVRKRIKELQEREHEIMQLRGTEKTKDFLEKRLERATRRRNTPFKLYVLELVEGKYYVGIARDVQKRFKQHGHNKGAKWTRTYKPVRIIQVIETKLLNMDEAAILEDRLTIEMAIQHGRDNVRGGGYCQTKPNWPQEVYDAEKGYTGL